MRTKRAALRASNGKVIQWSLIRMTNDSKLRSPTPRTDHLYPWPSYHDGPTLESQSPHTNLPGQRRTSSADSRSLAFVSVDVSRNNYGAPRRLSAPHIDSRSVPSDQGLPIETPPPKPPKPPLRLKLYPWMTQRESSPPRRTTPDDMIKCPYPTNGCTETLPKNMVVWRRHLTKKHGLVKDSVPQTCQWPGCTMTMGGRSLNRHVLMNHMDFKLSCPHCKVRRRYDHINKHILNCPSNPIGGASGG